MEVVLDLGVDHLEVLWVSQVLDAELVVLPLLTLQEAGKEGVLPLFGFLLLVLVLVEVVEAAEDVVSWPLVEVDELQGTLLDTLVGDTVHHALKVLDFPHYTPSPSPSLLHTLPHQQSIGAYTVLQNVVHKSIETRQWNYVFDCQEPENDRGYFGLEYEGYGFLARQTIRLD